MTNQTTIDKLHDMRLGTMADAFESQLQNADTFTGLSFEDRFGMLVDTEWAKRRSTKLQKLIRTADFRYPNACMEDIEYFQDRKLDKSQMLRLSTCRYIQEGHHIILEGASGNGKTFIACALGVAACRNFLKVRYIRLPELLNDLVVARGEGTFKKIIRTYQKVDLLIIDEWLLKTLTTEQAMDLFEIIEARTQGGSTIFCTQFDPRGWYERIGTPEDGTVSEAIIDRIIHNSFEIMVEGKSSMRERHGIKASKETAQKPNDANVNPSDPS
ncbi:MAG: IS21-like element helper ATPase IstB [Syntrophomonadaceae bacterium]|jgi:DNA replication protein DnaC